MVAVAIIIVPCHAPSSRRPIRRILGRRERTWTMGIPQAKKLRSLLYWLLLTTCPHTLAGEPAKKAPAVQSPLSPQQALTQFRLAPGLRMELVACEPQIESPVAMAFDEDGKLWVVEMRDYPNGPRRGQPPEGRIKILEDRDGNGRYEHARVFADRLLFANGLLPWKGGLIVT